MGFSSGIYRTKKYNNDTTYADVNLISHYFDYENNDWAKENYKTFEDYCKGMEVDTNTYYIPKTIIDFYTPLYIQREDQYSKSIYDELGYLCSSGAEFHDWIMNEFEPDTNYSVTITEDIAKKCLKYICTKLDEYKMKPVLVKYAYTEDTDSGEIKSIPCDGVEVEDENGNMKRILANEFEYTELYIPEKYFDDWSYNAWVNLRDIFINIITTTNWEEDIVVYNGGW